MGSLLLGLFWPGLAAANMNFYGTLIAGPQCTVSDKGAQIRVGFGSLQPNRIDGEQYRQPIPYQIKCPGLQSSKLTWKMRLTFKGTPVDFDQALLGTNVRGLAIRLLLDDVPLAINEPRQISLDSLQKPPLFEAVPVKKAGVQLPVREFSASGLLLVELY
ncbi:fimbrial protein [Pseudomonas sp. NFXW11]|uniref:fimbrial protein n=1 Tax=Pseudomonas sp. NFXW11 TaxID=2819531 RepID=UPI003CE6CBFB